MGSEESEVRMAFCYGSCPRNYLTGLSFLFPAVLWVAATSVRLWRV